MNTAITTYGRDVATANTEFQRVGATMTGRQSHVWVRTEDGWRIAAAHVSLLPQPGQGPISTADPTRAMR
jgi:ketosteroid isomerase-like protein